jgi:general secretion pathway protein D
MKFSGFYAYACPTRSLYVAARIRMEIHKPILTIQTRAMLLATACLIGPFAIQPRAAAGEPAETELSRRSADVQEARELISKGDEAYQAGRYDEAVEAFAGARDLIPDAPITAELRNAATQRYAQASVELARGLSRGGDVAAAKAALDKVLRDDVAPNDPGALTLRGQLDDPIRTNPALTREHAKHVDEVRRLLYTAEGAFDLGKFDEAKERYQDVLRIDATNTAARRGMERVAAAKSDYQDAAYDQSRAEMLGMVDAEWEIKAPPIDSLFFPGEAGALPGQDGMSVATKLDRIIIPRILLEQVTLSEAVDYLRAISVSEDTLAVDPASRGINFTLDLGPPDSEVANSIRSQKFDLQLAQVPLSAALRYITASTRTSYSTDEFSVIIRPLGATTTELITRDYRVPPDFLTNLSGGAGTVQADADPFAEPSDQGGLLTSRLSAQEALEKQGVAFPEGAIASYSPATNILRIVNTPLNQDIIAQIVEALSQTEPVAVSVQVTMIRTQQTNLDELGFDWIIGPFGNSGSNLFGSGGTVGNGTARTGSDFASPIDFTTIPGVPSDPTGTVSNIATAGLRSGDAAVTGNSIDAIINNPSRSSQSASVAPGILTLTGLFTDAQAQVVMRGLDQKKGVDLMAKPSILTRSGQAASILIAREFIYPTEYEPPELPNSVGTTGDAGFPVTPATPTAFETKEIGISLEVLPIADANKRYIDITLNPTIIDFDGFVNYGTPITSAVDTLFGTERAVITDNAILMPVFSSQKSTTQLTVADGSTVVYAGLMSDAIQTVEDKVPVLGDVPFLGRFFRSSSRKPTTSVVIFLVRVELLDPTGRPYRDR